LENSYLKDSIDDTIMLYKKNGEYAWAKFKCPCNCGKDVLLSLHPNFKPYWRVQLSDSGGKEAVTFMPSIWLTEYNCKSHFNINKNKITWVN